MSKNGHLTAAELTYVQFGITLRNDIAARYLRMVADAARDGVRVSIVSSHLGAGGYRSESVQLDMRARPSLYDITPGILPGLPSEHGDGTCADIATGLAWVKEHQDEYAVSFPVAGDPNHARFTTTTTAGTGTEIEDDDMNEDDRELLRRAVKASEENAFTLGQIKPIVDELHSGKGPVHAKLDVISWALSDKTAGLRTIVSGLIAKLGK